jgi:hypothetical protein
MGFSFQFLACRDYGDPAGYAKFPKYAAFM